MRIRKELSRQINGSKTLRQEHAVRNRKETNVAGVGQEKGKVV